MSDLRIYVNVSTDSPVQQSATPSCADAPPTQPRAVDTCRMGVALTTVGENSPPPRIIYFDRQGDQFALSPQNNAQNLTWVSSNQNLQGVLTTVRLASSLVRTMGRASTNADTMSYFLWLSRYIVTGNFQHDGASPLSPDLDINEMLIDIFSGSGGRGMVNLIGTLNLMRRETWVSEEARERIRSVTAILDSVPTYQAIVNHFFPGDHARYQNLTETQFTNLARVFQLIRRLTITVREGRPLRFDRAALIASRAYAEFYRAEIASGTRPEFCSALESALREQGGNSAPGAAFVSECRRALTWAEGPPDQAVRESARLALTDAAGMQRLQQSIASESALANMRIEWLSRRSAFGQVLDALLRRISLATGTAEGQPRLRFDVAGFQADLRRLTMLTSRGEYDLSALAFLRQLFASSGEATSFRVFAEGLVGDVPWQLSPQELSQIRALQASLQSRRVSSTDFSNLGMPVLLGGICAVGVGGIVLSQTLPALRSNSSAQLGVGLASSGLAGGGCLGLGGHYFWPATLPRAVHNRYAWDLGTSAVGSALGIGTYLLIHFLSGGRPIDPGQRFPIDSFGP